MPFASATAINLHRGPRSLPAWVQKTLREHARDQRDPVYILEQFDFAQTHDPLWNAAQTQILREGRIHNYLRMLWGKKILQWSRSPEDAAGFMIHVNNKCALAGRDPNSYGGIFWVLGRSDRLWAPVRPVFDSTKGAHVLNPRKGLRILSLLYSHHFLATLSATHE